MQRGIKMLDMGEGKKETEWTGALVQWMLRPEDVPEFDPWEK